MNAAMFFKPCNEAFTQLLDVVHEERGMHTLVLPMRTRFSLELRMRTFLTQTDISVELVAIPLIHEHR